MLSANKSLLLLVTCALLTFACTGSKKKPTTPTPINTGQGSDAERKLNNLEGQLSTLVGKITALQASAGKGDVSQVDLDKLEKSLTDAQKKIVELKQDTSNDGNPDFSGDLADLKNRIEKLETEKEKLEEKIEELGEEAADEEVEEAEETLEERSPAQEETTEKDSDTGSTAESLTIEVSLGKKDNDQNGTYVTFHSNQEVTIETITYGQFKQETPQDGTTSALSMTLPIAMKFKHNGTSGCVAAKLDLVQLLSDNTKKVAMTTKPLGDDTECAP